VLGTELVTSDSVARNSDRQTTEMAKLILNFGGGISGKWDIGIRNSSNSTYMHSYIHYHTVTQTFIMEQHLTPSTVSPGLQKSDAKIHGMIKYLIATSCIMIHRDKINILFHYNI
jgi:hypothetical protein